jgi:hypothetical protein
MTSHRIEINEESNSEIFQNKLIQYLKVPKCKILDLFDFNDFYTMKCL